MSSANFFAAPSYRAQQIAAKRRYDRLMEEGHDVVLPPDELPALVPEKFHGVLAANNTGNWANDWLMQGLVQQVKENAKGKILIPIIDTGYKAINEYIKPFWLEQYSTEHTGETGADGNGHAHLCAGNLFAKHPTIALGVIRELAEADLVRFTLHRGLRANGSGAYPNITDAIGAGASVKAPGFTKTILSMSFGGSSPYNPMEEVLQQARDAGVICNASAGNSGIGNGDTIGYPAKYDQVMAWGALQQDGSRASYSSVGPALFGTAPGSGILSTTNTARGLAYWNGTSGSEPIAVGVLACISLLYPDIDTQEELEAFAVEYMTDLYQQGFDSYTGHGAPKLSAYFDRTPVDDPDEPDNPGDDPGDDPSDPPASGRESRDVFFDFAGDWKMYWRTVEQQRLKVLTLTHFKMSTTTTAYTPIIATQIKAALNGFFGSRGLVIPTGQDYQDAANWSQYFFDMIQTKENGLELTIQEVHAVDEQGLPVTIPAKQIRAWNRRVNRMQNLTAKTFYYDPRLG